MDVSKQKSVYLVWFVFIEIKEQEHVNRNDIRLFQTKETYVEYIIEVLKTSKPINRYYIVIELFEDGSWALLCKRRNHKIKIPTTVHLIWRKNTEDMKMEAIWCRDRLDFAKQIISKLEKKNGNIHMEISFGYVRVKNI
jgi:hypothetical protein